VKFLFSPIGLILIVAILAILFFPRRTPDAVKKRMGKPMRAFPDDEPPPEVDAADKAGARKADSAKPESEPPDASGGSKGA